MMAHDGDDDDGDDDDGGDGDSIRLFPSASPSAVHCHLHQSYINTALFSSTFSYN